MKMPVRRFWAMERQIDRIRSEQDLREINVQRANASQDSMREVVDHLVLQIGDTTKIEINPFVRPEANYKDKLRKLADGS